MRAPAKINLHLGVGAPREDGFHPLTSVYQAVGVYDDLTVADADGWSVDVTVSDWMDRSHVPLAGDNIVDRAAALLAAHHGLAVSGDVHIDKAIPVAGGMAGGSADAAAALVALDRLWGARTPPTTTCSRWPRSSGSDVPFALVGGTALGTGPRRDRRAGDRHRHLVVGGGAVADRPVDAGDLPALRPALPGRPRRTPDAGAAARGARRR